MHILVIGGANFMGPHVIRRLHEHGHTITVFHRGRTEPDLPPEVQHLHGDRRNLAEFARALRAVAPEIVLDMVPMIEADARTVVERFRGAARRLVAISSGDVYQFYGRLLGKESGSPNTGLLTEDSPLRESRYPYRADPPRSADDPRRWMDDYDKILVERVVMSVPALPGTVLRLPMVYGPGDYQHRPFPYLKRMLDDRPTILLEERQARRRALRGYVENMAAGIALAVLDDRAAGRIYNLADETQPTEAEWVARIAEAAGWNGTVVPLPNERLLEHLRAEQVFDEDWGMDSGRIRQELGFYDPVPPDEAMRRTVAWERENMPEPPDPAAFDYAAEDASRESKSV